MHEKLNLRFLLFVTTTVLVFATVWFFVHRVQKNRRLTDYTVQATRAEQEGKLDRAARLLRAYVLAAPDDIDARIRYGGLLEKLSKTPRAKADALSVYEQALLKDPNRHDARRLAAELAVELRQWDVALKHLAVLLERKEFENDGRLWFLEGVCQEAKSDYEEAAKAYKTSCLTYLKPEPFVRRAVILREKREPKGEPAEDSTDKNGTEIGPQAILNEFVQKVNSFESYLARAAYHGTYTKPNGLDRAEKDLEIARQLAPDEVRVLLASAHVAVELAAKYDRVLLASAHVAIVLAAKDDHLTDAVRWGDWLAAVPRAVREGYWQQARGYLERGRSKDKKEAAIYLALADVESRSGRPDEAVKVLAAGRKEVRAEGLADVLFALGERYAETGDAENAGKAFEALQKLPQYAARKFASRVDFLRGLLFVQQRQWSEGSSVLERVRPFLTTDPDDMAVRIDLLLARCYGNLGNTERQLLTYRRAVIVAPFDYRPRLGLADTLLALGRNAEALEEYQHVTHILLRLEAQEPISSNLQRLAAEVTLRWDMDGALVFARKAVSANTTDYKERVWLGRILSVGGREAEAEVEFEAAVKLAGDKRDVWVAFVQHTVRPRPAGIGGILALARAIKIEDVLARANVALGAKEPLTLALCYDLAGRRDEAEKRYRAESRAKPSDALTLRATADFYQRNGAPQQAEPFLRDLITTTVKAPAEDVAWARRNLAIAVGLRPESPNFEEAIRLLDVNAAAGEQADDLRARALILAARPGTGAKVIELLERAEKLKPPQPEHEFLLAKVYEAEGNWPNARRRMRGLIRNQKQNTRYIEMYARSLLRRGELTEAEELVKSLADAAPNAPSTVRLQVSFYSRNNMPDRAIALCEEALKSTPLEQVIPIGLIAVSGRTANKNHFEKVEGWLNQAMEKDPKVNDLRFLLATLRELQGRYDDAEAEYRKVLANVPKHAGALNNLAFLLALRGKGAEALRTIGTLTNPPPEFLDTRAVAYIAAGDLAAARKDLEAATTDDGQATAYFHLAVVFSKLKDKKKATAALRQARNAGLQIGLLHPLERPTYDQLVDELKP